MTRLEWHTGNTRTFETGIDRGVLYPKDVPAVPWVGLSGIDETGAEGMQAYFLDGRPFLYLPKPKEYAAQIKAYTYPDEFSAIMGVPEVTDGMYVDSQQGLSFDLSYRSLVGDGISGEKAGYKIHLVYDAVVTPGGISYATLGSAIEPLEFTFDISAVPRPLVGYRPSAHIMIDTRHMDENKLAEIEELLYGTSTDDPQVPDPQVVFDTLSHGDAIIITDHGDGTWEASGSYKNIEMIGDGVFQIENVDGTDHGDGTFTISTTL